MPEADPGQDTVPYCVRQRRVQAAAESFFPQVWFIDRDHLCCQSAAVPFLTPRFVASDALPIQGTEMLCHSLRSWPWLKDFPQWAWLGVRSQLKYMHQEITSSYYFIATSVEHISSSTQLNVVPSNVSLISMCVDAKTSGYSFISTP